MASWRPIKKGARRRRGAVNHKSGQTAIRMARKTHWRSAR